jgi:hypothetical protein
MGAKTDSRFDGAIAEFERARVKRFLAAGMSGDQILAHTFPENRMVVRIALALERAEAICAKCRPAEARA